MHAVICREPEPAKWMVNRTVEDVKNGDIVVFLDQADAESFVAHGRAEAITPEDLAAALAGDGAEGGSNGDVTPLPADEPAPAKTTKKGRR